MRERVELSVGCSDRGQHPLTTLGDLAIISGLLRANQAFVYGTHANERKAECVWLEWPDQSKPEYRVNMRCPRCRRHVKWRHETAVRVLHQLTEAADGATPQLDISLLPGS